MGFTAQCNEVQESRCPSSSRAKAFYGGLREGRGRQAQPWPAHRLPCPPARTPPAAKQYGNWAIWELKSALFFASCSLHLASAQIVAPASNIWVRSTFLILYNKLRTWWRAKLKNIVTLAASSSNPVMKLALLQYSFLSVLGLPNPR